MLEALQVHREIRDLRPLAAYVPEHIIMRMHACATGHTYAEIRRWQSCGFVMM